MLTTDKINELLQINESYKAPARLMKILFDRGKREEMFSAFLEEEHNLNYDWFHTYFQEEHAQRKVHKQDFTPNSVSNLLSQLTGIENGTGTRFDVAAGSGGLTIQKWNEDRRQVSPFDYKPSMFFYRCEELSDRAVPFLLFNLLIRGMNAVLLHGDSLEREFKQIYFVQNTADDMMSFSELNVMPHSATATQEFDVRKWLESPYEHTESPSEFWSLPVFKMKSASSEVVEGQADLFEFI